jgi:hypothetical protein
VPTQDRRRRDQQSAAVTRGQQPGEGGDHGSIGPADPWPRSVALQNGQLMTQEENLDLLGCVGAGVKHHPAQKLREHLVDQIQRHQSIMPLTFDRESAGQQVSRSAQSFGHRQALSEGIGARALTPPTRARCGAEPVPGPDAASPGGRGPRGEGIGPIEAASSP